MQKLPCGGHRILTSETTNLTWPTNLPRTCKQMLGKGRCRDSLRQRANAFSAAAHLALMFLRMICIGVNGVPIFFA